MILLLLATLAHAGELQITTPSPVLVFIDGKPGNYVIGTDRVEALDLDPGQHEVVIRTLLGRKVTSLLVDVPADMQVQLDYNQRQLLEVARSRLHGRRSAADATQEMGPKAAVLAGQNTRCVSALLARSWNLDCATRPPELTDEDRDRPFVTFEQDSLESASPGPVTPP